MRGNCQAVSLGADRISGGGGDAQRTGDTGFFEEKGNASGRDPV